MMKKVTIITPPEYEGIILDALGRARVVQLKEVTGPEFTGLVEREIDFKPLYERVRQSLRSVLEYLKGLELTPQLPEREELQRLMDDPEGMVGEVLEDVESLISRLQQLELRRDEEIKRLMEELQARVEKEKAAYQEAVEKLREEIERLEEERGRVGEELEERYRELKARLESVRALEPEEFKRCFSVGLAKKEVIGELEVYLKRYPDLFYKTVDVNPEEVFIFIFGSEEHRRWVEALFLVFDVKDVFDILNPGDVLLVLDPEKREEAIRRYQERLEALKAEREKIDEKIKEYDERLGELEEKLRRFEENHSKNIEDLKEKYDRLRREVEERYEEEIKEIRGGEAISRLISLNYMLRLLSDERIPTIRSRVVAIIQGWVPDKRIPRLQRIIGEVEKKIDERIYMELEDPEPHEQVPTPPPELKPKVLQPAWTLTALRGWPSLHEINPAYITILVFSFQFGLMFGDVGQGAVYLILGLLLSKRYRRGMMSKLGALFIPMGVSAIIFGFLYGEVFLIEGLIHPILFSPLHDIGKLMKTVLGIAVAEMCFGLILGAINHIREGEPLGALGEHGLGALLFVLGLYLGALHYLKVGDIFRLFGHYSFFMMITGLILSTLEPILIALRHRHLGMEAMGEGIGALLMTFVESLANLFSFLRIAAFALAHASLAIAAHSLGHFMGPGGLVLTNIIAMTFEFVSSSVQSLRLLYYEFMGKFFQGGGIRFRPFRLNIIDD